MKLRIVFQKWFCHIIQFFCQIFATFTLLCHTRVIYISIQYLLTYLVLTYLHLICLLHLPLFFLTQKILSKSAYLLIGQPFFCSYFWMTHFFMVLQSQGGPSNFRWISEEGVLVLYDDSAVWIRRFVQKFYLNPS